MGGHRVWQAFLIFFWLQELVRVLFSQLKFVHFLLCVSEDIAVLLGLKLNFIAVERFLAASLTVFSTWSASCTVGNSEFMTDAAGYEVRDGCRFLSLAATTDVSPSCYHWGTLWNKTKHASDREVTVSKKLGEAALHVTEYKFDELILGNTSYTCI